MFCIMLCIAGGASLMMLFTVTRRLGMGTLAAVAILSIILEIAEIAEAGSILDVVRDKTGRHIGHFNVDDGMRPMLMKCSACGSLCPVNKDVSW